MSDRADTILCEAIRLFAERGFSGTTLADVERAAGFAPGRGAIYRYFPDKESIFRAAVRREIAVAASLRPAPGAIEGSPVDALVARIALAARHVVDIRLILAVLAHDAGLFPDLLPEISDLMVDAAIAVDAAAAEDAARDAGCDIDAVAFASLLLDTVAGHGLLSVLVDPRRDADPSHLIDVLGRLVRARLAPEASGA